MIKEDIDSVTKDNCATDENKTAKSYFPFQTQTQLDRNVKTCPIQKRFDKLNRKLSPAITYNDMVKELNDRLLKNMCRSSANAKRQVKIIRRDLEFLQLNKPFLFQFAKTNLEPRTYSYLQERNRSILYRNNSLAHLKGVRGLTKNTAVYFYPNKLLTREKDSRWNTSSTFLEKVKSSSGKIVLETLRFLFVDIDDAESIVDVKNRIALFGLDPDILIQTSERGFHLYWSIQHIGLETNVEDKRGNQQDSRLILYELALRKLISIFRSDKARSNASSLMRAPGFWNIKHSKNRKFEVKYIGDSRTLEAALKEPKHRLDDIVNHISKISCSNLVEEAEIIYNFNLIPKFKDDNGVALTDDQVELVATAAEKKVEFDFAAGWNEALTLLLNYFKISQDYFNKNDLLVLKHIWTYRLCEKITFPKSLRDEMKGSGSKYSDLNLSIGKIANLTRRVGNTRTPLIRLTEYHKLTRDGRQGRRRGYTVSPIFLEACGQRKSTPSQDWFNIIRNDLYKRENRYERIPYDCFILRKILKFSKEDAYRFLVDKIDRSSSQDDETLRCSNDISNLEVCLKWYYK